MASWAPVKLHFVSVLRDFDYLGAVKSPTYTLVEPYKIDLGHINHFDFFRIAHPDELNYVGIEEYFSVEHAVFNRMA